MYLSPVHFGNPRTVLRILIFLLLSFGFAEAQTIRQQMGIPLNDSLLNKTHAERYKLLHGFYDNNLVLPQLDTVVVEQVLADVGRFAKKHDDQDLVRELRYMRLVVQILHTDRMKRIRLLEHRFEEIKKSGKSWEVFLYSWLLGSQLLDTRGKADMGLYLLTDASETLHRGYRHPIERYLNYFSAQPIIHIMT